MCILIYKYNISYKVNCDKIKFTAPFYCPHLKEGGFNQNLQLKISLASLNSSNLLLLWTTTMVVKECRTKLCRITTSIITEEARELAALTPIPHQQLTKPRCSAWRLSTLSSLHLLRTRTASRDLLSELNRLSSSHSTGPLSNSSLLPSSNLRRAYSCSQSNSKIWSCSHNPCSSSNSNISSSQSLNLN